MGVKSFIPPQCQTYLLRETGDNIRPMKSSMARSYPAWLRTLARAATVLYAVAVIVLSLMPGQEVPLGNISDKYRHAAAYAVLAVLLSVSFLGPRLKPTLLAFLLVAGFGFVIEFIQPSFNRTFDLYDELANSIGAAIGCGLLIALRALTTRRATPVPA